MALLWGQSALLTETIALHSAAMVLCCGGFLVPHKKQKQIYFSIIKQGDAAACGARGAGAGGAAPPSTGQELSTAFSKVVHRLFHALAVWESLWSTGRRQPVGKAVGILRKMSNIAL